MTHKGERLVLALILTLGVLMSSAAGADPITVTVSSGPMVQQLDDSNGYALMASQKGAGTITSSYTVGQLRGLVTGDLFSVGIDLNQAMGQNGGAFTLSSFALSVGGQVWYSTAGSSTLFPTNPGSNGYWDAALGTFDLSGLANNQIVTFTATFSGGTGGRDNFILGPPVRIDDPGDPVGAPEPATLFMLGSGLAGAAMWRRRVKQGR